MQDKLKNIKMLIMDVDGVLTDGNIFVTSKGTEIKSFHVRDGYGIKLLQDNGIKTAIISGRYSKCTVLRAKELGIKYVYQTVKNKLDVIEEILKKTGFDFSQIAYIGDDLPDLGAIKQVGFSACVADGTNSIKEIVDYVCENKGGKGAVREVCDLILKFK